LHPTKIGVTLSFYEWKELKKTIPLFEDREPELRTTDNKVTRTRLLPDDISSPRVLRQRKKDKRTYTNLDKNTHKSKDRVTRTQLKTRVNAGVPKG
jgi:hypothetical protein